MLAIAAGFLLHISPGEWLVIDMVIGMVLIAEAFNSAFEKLSDKLHPGRDIQIKKLKDISAAAVLIAAITAVITAGIVFLPKT